jgi:uncharacterized membrane protein HdeD (DUF308 family)
MKEEAVNSRKPSLIPQTSSITRVVLGTLLVLAGVLAAIVTVLARRENENSLAGVAAILSLLIALLLAIFIVPPWPAQRDWKWRVGILRWSRQVVAVCFL